MSARTVRGLAAVDLLEEAVQVLRQLPPETFVIYYMGSLPFVLGFLYFWTDMSHGAFAYSYCLPDALLISLLFVWMKSCQAVFAQRVKAYVCFEESPEWPLKRIFRLVSVQTAIQSTGLILLPLAALITLPFGWVYAFYQNLSFFGDGKEAGFSTPFRKAARNAALLPTQNHLAILILAGFGLFVTLDIALALYIAPYLLKMLLGIETTMTVIGYRALNTTFLALVFAVAYLAFDPLVKTVYVLRCFYGEALKNGDDLKVGLKAFKVNGKRNALVPVFIALLSLTVPAKATAAQSAQEIRRGVDKAQMERSIELVLSRREFSWRMPRQKPARMGRSPRILLFLSDTCKTAATWLRPLKQRVLDFIKWLARQLSAWNGQAMQNAVDNDWQNRVKALVYFVLCLTASALIAITLKLFRASKARGRELPIEVAPAVPDLESESIKADALHEDEWTRMASGLIAEGKYRPALRALYLAALSHLAQKNIVVIELSKSNRDYEREIKRKAPYAEELQEAFAQNSRLFERTWYGLHDVTKETLNFFTINQERILSGAEGS